jgi:hypothetical protein
MPRVWELVPLALLSAVYPTLVAVVVIALAGPRPAHVMAFFLVGGMIASVGVGLAIVFAFQDVSFVSDSNPGVDPVVYFAVGAIAFLLAALVRRRPPPSHEGPGRFTRTLSRRQSGRVAFLVGVLLNIAPGAFYVVALKDIAQADLGTAEIVAVTIAFCIVMYALIEIPLLGFVVAPERAADLSRRFSAWLGENSRTLGVAILFAAGCYLVLRGILSLV